MNNIQLALDCITQTFAACPDIEHETAETVVAYTERWADAWQSAHHLLERSNNVGKALATMMELNLELSGPHWGLVAQRPPDPANCYEDAEWLHDMYVANLSALAQILSAFAETQP